MGGDTEGAATRSASRDRAIEMNHELSGLRGESDRLNCISATVGFAREIHRVLGRSRRVDR